MSKPPKGTLSNISLSASFAKVRNAVGFKETLSASGGFIADAAGKGVSLTWDAIQLKSERDYELLLRRGDLTDEEKHRAKSHLHTLKCNRLRKEVEFLNTEIYLHQQELPKTELSERRKYLEDEIDAHRTRERLLSRDLAVLEHLMQENDQA